MNIKKPVNTSANGEKKENSNGNCYSNKTNESTVCTIGGIIKWYRHRVGSRSTQMNRHAPSNTAIKLLGINTKACNSSPYEEMHAM